MVPELSQARCDGAVLRDCQAEVIKHLRAKKAAEE